MSRTSEKMGTKAPWRKLRKENGKSMPYGKKAVRNFREKSND